MNNKNPKYIYWLEDPSILYENKNYQDFIPTKSMSRIEQLNSLVRLAIYFTIINYIFNDNKDNTWNYLSILLIGASISMYFITKNDPNENEKELNKLLEEKKEINDKKKKQKQMINNNVDVYDSHEYDDVETEPEKDYNIEIGYNDESGEITFPEYDKLSDNEYEEYEEYINYNNDKIDPLEIYSRNDIINSSKNTCRMPSEDNPFMNSNIVDYENESDNPQACNIEDDEIKEKTNDFFNKDLYRNLDDLFDTKNSQRQFYTTPNTKIPPNTVQFANWLYGTMSTCKENQENCLRYEDLRYKR